MLYFDSIGRSFLDEFIIWWNYWGEAKGRRCLTGISRSPGGKSTETTSCPGPFLCSFSLLSDGHKVIFSFPSWLGWHLWNQVQVNPPFPSVFRYFDHCNTKVTTGFQVLFSFYTQLILEFSPCLCCLCTRHSDLSTALPPEQGLYTTSFMASRYI